MWSHAIGEGITKETEKMLGKLCGHEYCILTNCATNALFALGLAYEVSGRRVITVSNSPWTIASFKFLNANLVFADTLSDGNIDPNSVAREIDGFVPPIVLAVDYEGIPHDAEKLQEVCSNSNATLIVDASKSFSVQYGENLASYGSDAIVLSFGPGKTFLGELGAILTDDTRVYESVLRSTMHPERFRHEVSFTMAPHAVPVKTVPCPWSVMALRKYLKQF